MTVRQQKRIRVLYFQAEQVALCADLKYIKKVLPLVNYEFIPNSPAYVVGLINVAGTSIPLIDLTMRLGLAREHDYTLATPVLLCADGKLQAALIVDEITSVETIDSKDLQLQGDFAESVSFVQGAIPLQEKIALLLNIPEVMQISFGEAPLV